MKNKRICELDNLTILAKRTKLGKKILQEMEPQERWVNDFSPDGKIIGKFEMTSRKYEKINS